MPQLLGNLSGLKKSQLRQLEKLSQRSVSPDVFISPALAEELCSLSLEHDLPLTLLLDRKGRVYQVFVGSTAAMGESGLVAFPRNAGLCGIRAVTTQLEVMAPPSKAGLTTLLQYRLDTLVTLVATEHPQWSHQFGEHPKACDAVYLHHLRLDDDQRIDVAEEGPFTLHQIDRRQFQEEVEGLESDLYNWARRGQDTAEAEKAFLIGLARPGKQGRHQAEDVLDELSLLTRTAGAMVVGRTLQSRDMPDPKYYVGQGKAQALAFEIQQAGANLIIADDELSSVQQRTLEKILRTRVVDRTELILDIFAQRAQSWEGKIQVELAQLQYLLPRLAGKGHGLSQQTATSRGGAIATRGPGETKLELDRRRLRTRIHELEHQAESVRQHRTLQRKDRLEKGMPIIALVGYTNAGKSTLLNALTQAGAVAEDKLFATLDPLTRKLVRPGMAPCLLIDTVGFIQKLPTTLVKAFRSTLEEIQSATLILHVADISHPDRIRHLEVVQETLSDLACGSKPQWLLFNKMDLMKNLEAELQALEPYLDDHPVFPISAKTTEGFSTVLEALAVFLENPGDNARDSAPGESLPVSPQP